MAKNGCPGCMFHPIMTATRIKKFGSKCQVMALIL